MPRKKIKKRIKSRARKKLLITSLAAAVLLLTTAYIPLKKYVFKNSTNHKVEIASTGQIVKIIAEESKSTKINANIKLKNDQADSSQEKNIDKSTDKIEDSSLNNNIDNKYITKTDEISEENTTNNNINIKDHGISSEKNVDNNVPSKTEETSSENNVDKDSIDKPKEISPNEEENVNNKEVDTNNFSDYDANIFSNSVFFGDSLTEAMSYYDYLSESNVLGIIGLNTISSLKHVDSLGELNPQNIFILMGCNDLEGNTSAKLFIDNYTNLIHEIKNKLPNSNIYVQSILPITKEIQNQNSAFSDERINEFNASIKSMADSEGINYINLHELINSLETDYHEPDGIHFRHDFYPKWLSFIQYKIFN